MPIGQLCPRTGAVLFTMSAKVRENEHLELSISYGGLLPPECLLHPGGMDSPRKGLLLPMLSKKMQSTKDGGEPYTWNNPSTGHTKQS